MRVANWSLITGLSLAASFGLWNPPQAGAWQASDAAMREPAEPSVPPMAVTRWSNDPSSVQRAGGQSTSSDGVQQAAWNASTQGIPTKRKTSANPATSSGSGNSSPPTFHGYNLKMPTLPFSRTTAKSQPAANYAANGYPASGYPANTQQQTASATSNRSANPGRTTSHRSNMTASPNMASSGSSATPTGRSAMTTTKPQTATTPSAAPPIGPGRPSPQIRRGPVNPLTNHASATTTESSTAELAIASSPIEGPILVSPANGPKYESAAPAVALNIESSPISTSSAQVSTAPIASAPTSPADQLLVSAHEMAATAQTELELSRVIETCRRARASHPTPQVSQYAGELVAWAMNRRGQLRAENGRAKDALLDFDDAVRLDPKCWRALHNRGVLLAQTGQFEKAFDDFNRTIQLNPDFAKAYSNRAALFVVAGDVLPALADYSKAIELEPNLSVAHRGRGRVCHLLGRLDEAIGHYDAAVQLAPDDGYAIASRADLMTDMGRYAEAASEYERAIQVDPNSTHAFRGSAWLLATCPDESIRDPGLAVQRAEMATRIESRDDSVTMDTLAAALANKGDFDGAIKTLERAMEVAPENERDVYADRMLMYQHGTPYRISPLRSVAQASYQQR